MVSARGDANGEYYAPGSQGALFNSIDATCDRTVLRRAFALLRM